MRLLEDKNIDVLKDLEGLMNELNTLDPNMVRKIVDRRVNTNIDVAKHDTVQVGVYKGTQLVDCEPGIDDKCFYRVGMLGILNGLTLKYGYLLYADIGDGGSITGFRLVKNEVDNYADTEGDID